MEDLQIQKLLKSLKKEKQLNAKLRTLVDVTSIIASSLDKSQVLKSILDQTKKLMDCNDSSVLLINPEENKLYFEVVANEEDFEKLKNIRLSKGEGIAGTVWETGLPELIKNAGKDKNFSKKADSKLKHITKSIIAVPLVVNNTIIGVMEAMNKHMNECFTKDDLKIFQSLAIQAAIAIENAQLYEMAITDGMTKLFIKRYFIVRITEELSRAKRYNRDVSLLMFDIDHFKIFNDTHGHQAGDAVLIQTAKLIRDGSRNCDTPARYGGEEFALILPETNLSGALEVGERLRKQIESQEIMYDKNVLRLTISIGVASYSVDKPKDYEDLIRMADMALYYSKENGRNRVSPFSLCEKK